MKTCSILDCDKPNLAKTLCQKHYYRLKRGQDVLGKSRFDRRPAVVEGDVAKLELANGKGYTLVDADMVDLQKHNWSKSVDGYAVTWYEQKVTKLQHLVIGRPPEGFVVDHINRDKLDNRKSNLRYVTQKDNILNSTLPEYFFPKGTNKPGRYTN